MTSVSRSDRDYQAGSILILALIVMTAVVSLGLAYLEVSALGLQTTDMRLTRLQAQCTATSGMEVAHQRLAEDPTFRGTFSGNVGSSSYIVDVRDLGTGAVIESIGRAGAATFGVRSECEPVAGATEVLDVQATLTANRIEINNSRVVWGGDAYYADRLAQSGSDAAMDGNDQVVVSTPFTLAPDLLAAAATRTHAAGTNVPSGSYTGVHYVAGDCVLNAPLKIHGSVFVNGDVVVEGAGEVTIVVDTESAAIVATGNITIEDATALRVVGGVVGQGNVTLRDIDEAEIRGPMLTNGTLSFVRANSVIANDPTFSADPPTFFSSGSMRPSPLRESRRTPFTP